MRVIYLLFLVFSAHLAFSQTMMLVERPGTVRNYIFEAGDFISLKTINGEKISGPINIIHDSSLVVDFTHELELNEIDMVYQPRYLINIFGSAFIGGSLLYLTLDGINGGMKNKNLIEDPGFLTSTGLLASGVVMKLLSKKKMRIDNKKWRIKILKS